MSINDIITLLNQDNVNNEDWVRSLQSKLYELNPSRYCTNFNHYGADGDLGDLTRKDIMKFLEDNPAAILDLGDNLKESLINNQCGRKLIEIASKDESVQEILKAEIDNILENKQLSDLTTDELKTVQANWAILGEYNGKVDGIIGRRSQAAYFNHTRSGHINYTPDPIINDPSYTFDPEQSYSPVGSTYVAPIPEYVAPKDSVIIHLIGGGRRSCRNSRT